MTKKIVVYKTDENGFHLIKDAMSMLIDARDLSKDIDVVGITGKEIQNRGLGSSDVLGLILPGRNKGQDYRDELTEEGCRNIQHMTSVLGLANLDICAGSYIMSQKVVWDNSLISKDDKKEVINNYPLFEGTATGPFNTIGKDGYRGKETNQFLSSTLYAQVSPVVYHKSLTRTDDENGYGVYWGGGDFILNSKDQKITALVSHRDFNSFPNNLSYKPDAVIEFDCGHGKVIFSNIHPEITPQTFTDLFQQTEEAKAHPRKFNENRKNLEASELFNRMIFERFLDNCLASPRGRVLNVKKQVAEPELNG